MDVCEGEGAGEDDCPGRPEKIAVALEDKGAVDDALGIHRQHGVENQHEAPESRIGSRKAEELSRRSEAQHEGDPDGDGGGEEAQYGWRVMAQRRGVPETGAVEVGIVQEHEETPGCQRPQNGNGRDAVARIGEQGGADKEERQEFERVQGHRSQDRTRQPKTPTPRPRTAVYTYRLLTRAAQ